LASQQAEAHSEVAAQLPVMNCVPGGLPEETNVEAGAGEVPATEAAAELATGAAAPPLKLQPSPSCSATSRAAQRPLTASQQPEAQSLSPPQGPVMNWVPVDAGAEDVAVPETATATGTAEEATGAVAAPPSPVQLSPSSCATSFAAQRPLTGSQQVDSQSVSDAQLPVMNCVPGGLPEGVWGAPWRA